MRNIDKLISWLRTKDPKASYFYGSCSECLMAQFYTEQGYKSVIMGPFDWSHRINNKRTLSIKLPKYFDEIALALGLEGGIEFTNKSRTYGGALARALQVKEKTTARVKKVTKIGVAY